MGKVQWAPYAHALAHLDEDVWIGKGTRVWQFASVIRGAKVGRDCTVASCAIVDGATIGDRCILGHGAQVHPGSLVGSDVFIGPGVVLANDSWPRVDKAGFDPEKFKAGFVSVRIEDGASIGANAVILPGVKVGAGAMVAAGAVVHRDVPAKLMWPRLGGACVAIAGRQDTRMREARC